ncbi:acyltransferase family protein [Clostridium transplantifaecale]|uniref:acyltransferase family protein n=1 Tax=Clostridium transplantifaecale TaxID=2479838 RepID=UPI000F63005F
MKIRDYDIDLLKALSCLAVIGLHTIGKYFSTGNVIAYYLCEFAIPMFFMTSGFLILNGGTAMRTSGIIRLRRF